MSTADDTYTLPSGDKVFLPAGTNVHPVQWAIHRDEELYPRPEEFIPERWLDPEWKATFREPLTQYPNLQNYSAFGFGRRICPGVLRISLACAANVHVRTNTTVFQARISQSVLCTS